jgi:hypothetical protein
MALRAAQTGWRSLDIHLMQWVDLFYPFTAVELPRIPREFETHIAPVLHELTEPRGAEVLLPALNSLIFEELGPSSNHHPSGILQRAIDGFIAAIAARERSGHPVDVRR